MEIDAVRHGFSVVMFMNVHEIVHDPFFSLCRGSKSSDSIMSNVLEFAVSGFL